MDQSSNSFSVRIHPGQLRFSAAHFITFGGMCENLHGHNFHVRIDAHGDNNIDGFVIDFVELTRCAAAVCATLHDRILLPGQSSEVLLERADGLIYVSSHGKRFSFPEENCAVLPIVNATAEILAHYIAGSVIEHLRASTTLDHVREIEVAVEEADQQWGICRMRIGDED